MDRKADEGGIPGRMSTEENAARRVHGAARNVTRLGRYDTCASSERKVLPNSREDVTEEKYGTHHVIDRPGCQSTTGLQDQRTRSLVALNHTALVDHTCAHAATRRT